MTEAWDDDGAFELVADQVLEQVDLVERDPFDLSKALDCLLYTSDAADE